MTEEQAKQLKGNVPLTPVLEFLFNQVQRNPVDVEQCARDVEALVTIRDI